MRLMEAIIEANRKAVAWDQVAPLNLTDVSAGLPLVALTCIDARLNHLMPQALGIPEDRFIWLRNSGNIIFDSMSSMTRTLAMACVIKEGREIAIIGHTDCLVRKTNMLELTEKFRSLGIDRSKLPENLNEFFGFFASERQNVIRSCEIVRSSVLIGPRIPVHGLLIDTFTGKLEWTVNGYEELERRPSQSNAVYEGASGLSDTIQRPQQSGSANSIGSHGEVEQKQTVAPQTVVPEVQVLSVQPSNLQEDELGAPGQGAIGSALPTEVGSAASRLVERIEKAAESSHVGKHLEKFGALTQSIADWTGSDKVAKLATHVDFLTRLGKVVSRQTNLTIIGHDQKRYGPVAADKLVKWFLDGRIDLNTPVQVEGSSGWVPLKLLPDAMKSGVINVPSPPKWKKG